ncbi:MAG: J domain-containing protein [Candidatus Eisenbacteria bacterium]|nr:J domain-containing protein [Candidatus Eisenbacteria bacterium]
MEGVIPCPGCPMVLRVGSEPAWWRCPDCGVRLECRDVSSKIEVVQHVTKGQLAQHRALLDVARGATRDDIGRAFRAKVVEYHPDKVASLGKELRDLAARKTRELNEAHRILRDLAGVRVQKATLEPASRACTPSPDAGFDGAASWLVSRMGETKGPVPEDQVVEWIRGGMTDGFVRHVEGSDWIPLAASPFASFVTDARAALATKSAQESPEVRRIVFLVAVSEFSKLWPDDLVKGARELLVRELGRVPTLEDLAPRLGEAFVANLAESFVRDRQAELRGIAEQLGLGSPCHLCGGERDESDPYVEFGMARNVQSKTEWAPVIGMLALNVVALPLGFVVGAGPGSSTTAEIARCRLVVCSSCAEERKGLWGGIKVDFTDFKKHPSFGRLYAAGHTQVLSAEKLREFKPV